MSQSTSRARRAFLLVATVVVAACVSALIGVAGAVDGTTQADGVEETVQLNGVDDDPHIDIRIRGISLPEFVDAETDGVFELEVFNAGRDDARMELTHEIDGTVVTESEVVADRGSSTETSYTVSYDAIEDAIGPVEGEQTLSQQVTIHAVGVEGGEEFDEAERGAVTVVGPEPDEDEAGDGSEEPAGSVDDVRARLVDITETAEVDESVSVAVELRNPTDVDVDGEIHYGAATDAVHRQHVELAAGESNVIRFEVPVERISRAADIRFPPGEVDIDHHVRVRLAGAGERAEALTVEASLRVIVDEERWQAGEYADLEGIAVDPVDEPDEERADETEEAQAAETEPQADDETLVESQQQAESEESQRGFLTNDGDGTGTPLDDPFVLTVVGFLLSVLSILYQMSRM